MPQDAVAAWEYFERHPRASAEEMQDLLDRAQLNLPEDPNRFHVPW